MAREQTELFQCFILNIILFLSCFLWWEGGEELRKTVKKNKKILTDVWVRWWGLTPFCLYLDLRQHLQFHNLGPLHLLSWFNLLSIGSATCDGDMHSSAASGTTPGTFSAERETQNRSLSSQVCRSVTGIIKTVSKFQALFHTFSSVADSQPTTRYQLLVHRWDRQLDLTAYSSLSLSDLCANTLKTAAVPWALWTQKTPTEDKMFCLYFLLHTQIYLWDSEKLLWYLLLCFVISSSSCDAHIYPAHFFASSFVQGCKLTFYTMGVWVQAPAPKWMKQWWGNVMTQRGQ